MRAQWESLHAALIRSVTSRPAAEQYQQLRRSETILARFDSVDALLAYLPRNDAELDAKDRDEKDQIYAALVRAVRARAPCARVARDLAWCGLWPGLDRIYRRRLRHFGDDPDELTQVIWLSFTELVNRLDLAHVQRVSASLVRSTDRDVRKALRRAAGARVPAAAATLQIPHASSDDASDDEPASGPEVVDRSTLNLSFAGELAQQRAQLIPLVGSDADLVIAVLVLEVEPREVAARMGLTYAAARKRLQRAVLRILAQLRPAGASAPVSQSPDPLVNRLVPETDDDDE